jgi:hypothetical protein
MDLQQALPTATLYVAPLLAGEEWYLLAVSRTDPACLLRGHGPLIQVEESCNRLRGCLDSQLARYRSGLALGRHERAELDACLDELGQGPLGQTLSEALSLLTPVRRVVWAPDGSLHGLPVQALRRQRRYLIEDLEITWALSGALFVHHRRTRRQTRGSYRPALVVADSASVLPTAGTEAQGVASTFFRHRVLQGMAATRASLRTELARARVVHFACHAYFDREHPLSASIRLPSGETMRALDWLNEPVQGLPLVTLSACRSAAVAPLGGGEVFGHVSGLLGGGVRAVLACLWPVADREAVPLMWRFYRHRLIHDLASALAFAQREMIADGSSPLFWAALALFGDATAIPQTAAWLRPWARWRQCRHARLYPIPEDAASGILNPSSTNTMQVEDEQ